MAIGVRDTSGAVNAAATSHPITLPAGTVSGDLLIVVFAHDNATNVASIDPSSDAGWANADRQQEGETTNLGGNFFWKRANGSDSLTIATTESQEAAYIVAAIQDADDPLFAGGSSGGTSPVQPPALAVPSGDYLPIILVGLDQNSPSGDTLALSGYTTVREEVPTDPTGSWVSAHLLVGNSMLVGTTSIAPGSITPSGGNDQSVSWTIGLAEAISAPASAPHQVVNIKQASGGNHYAFDIAEAGAASRVLYDTSQIEAGLNIDPEFTVFNDGTLDWVKCSTQADAPTTGGSSNPRSEGREQDPGGDVNTAFNPLDGNTHWQRFRCKIVEHPLVNNVGIATGQLHSLDDDIIMVRSRVVSGTNTLVLRVYDPGTLNTVDVLTLDANYAFNEVYDVMILVKGSYFYVFFNDFTVPVYRDSVSIFPNTGTYMFKWGNYLQFNEGTSGISATDIGTTHYRNVHHFHTGWAAPEEYTGIPTTDPGVDAVATVGVEFTRVATDSGTITERKWTILEGPDGVGSVIGTSASLAWTPTVAGNYTLLYGAKNDNGWSNLQTIEIAVSQSTGGGEPPAVDASSPTRVTASSTVSSVTTSSFTPPGDSVLVATLHKDGSTPSNSATFSNSGTALTWTRLGQTQTGNGGCAIGYAVVPSGGIGSTTVTGTFSGASNNQYSMKVDVVTGVDPADIIGLVTSGSSSTSSDLGVGPFVPEIPGSSLMFVAVTAATGNNSSTPTATGFDDWNGFNANSEVRGGRGYVLSSDVDSYTIENTGGNSYDWNWVAVEIRGLSATAPLVNAGIDANIDQYETFSRTAIEDDGGDPITTRTWTVFSGPNQVGETLSTSATVNWEPTVDGIYVLRYTATNAIGSGSDDVQVTVNAVSFNVGGTLNLSGNATGLKNVSSSPSAPLTLSGSLTEAFKNVSGAVEGHLVLIGAITHPVFGHINLFGVATNVSRATEVDVNGHIDLTGQMSGAEHHTSNVDVTANLILNYSSQTSSIRFNNNVFANLILQGFAEGERIIIEAPKAILPRADTTTRYEVVVVARVPQVSGPPLLFEIDPIEWTRIRYSEELNRPSQMTVDCKVSSLPDSIIDRLTHMSELPSELRVYRNGVPTFVGPLLGWRVQGDFGDRLSLQAMSLLGYLRYMYVTEDLLFDQVDQHAIVSSLIAHWQNQEYGHFGIDADDLPLSGVLRYVTYPRDELHNIGQRIQSLGERENGFDITINPSSRRVILNTPRLGVDRSTGEDAIVFDNRNVRSPNVVVSAAPGDVASDAFGIGEDGRFSAQANLELRQKFGRTGVAVSFYTVEEQDTLDSYTRELLSTRNEALVVPGPDARVTPDSDLADYDIGDTVIYQVHTRLGVGNGVFRIRKRQVSVSATGQESVSLEFV